MEWLDVLDRIGTGESERAEFKRGLGDLSAVGRTVCSFANTVGGVVILGVTDSQQIVGVSEDAEHIQEQLTSFLRGSSGEPARLPLAVTGASMRSRR